MKTSFSRRSFLHVSAAASAVTALHAITEPMLAAAARPARQPRPMDAILIDSNENPLGPSQAAREAMIAIVPKGGRYGDGQTDELVHTFAQMEGLNPDYVRAFPGSTGPLRGTVIAFTSKQKSYVTADPCFEAGMYAAEITGARVVKVPLTSTYAHDVKAMLAAGADAGMFYVCTPNNPTGTMTSHADIEYLVENKPKDSVVVVDEAYLHFSSGTSALDLVKAGKDVVVLRTFSKAYGMAGIRCGFAVARPDLLDRVTNYGGFTFMPVTALVAALASLKDPQLVPERKRINASVRQETFAWLDSKGYKYIPSEANCFMLETKRPGKEMIAAMAEKKVMIGRVWPVMPTWVRITVGTHEEMAQFCAAFGSCMTGAKAMALPFAPLRRNNHVLLS